MLLSDLVSTSAAVAATPARTEKTRLIAEALAAAEPDERALVARYLAGRLRQRRTGLGWRSLRDLPPPAPAPSLTVVAVDAAFDAMAALAGPGSAGARTAAATSLFAGATEAEQAWLRAAALGEVRQGASDALLVDALAAATSHPVAEVRRAAMLAGGVPPVVAQAFAGTLDAIRFEVGRPVLPMLAASAPDLAAAWEKVGAVAGAAGTGLAVDAKLDGIRIQAHRRGGEVLLVTRTLEEITARLPEVVDVVAALPGGDLVLDGEALLVGPDGRPRPFQETAARTASTGAGGARVAPYFFDLLHLDGRDLLAAPAQERWDLLAGLVPEQHRVARWRGADPAAAEEFARRVLAAGHEGVVVKAPGAPYDAGRRGSAWVKVKPVHTLDLVVLAVEWGSGRRRGWLSNIHLGARAADGSGWVMVGKTFKGMTDAMLAWQTERFLELETHRDGHVVHVRPEQVVEIAFDGVQRSTRYPGGAALRFARVVHYRDDKPVAEADTIDTVRAYLGGGPSTD
ncbi:ATP-dependent DNA ligase [Nocardioides sp. GY 10113]|uniref:ATP-dependent DNA ligase n=1 Tax=Nocardioides sp. GY 10113 TaxID=2569761 RepID=UPI0010A940AA|nr:ATP-dependent DNA ligase [Nocardioides sp. GY 10113]TIC83879.1 ATP-dependent DNA ligase [Nocardioides sp. GY 10113]